MSTPSALDAPSAPPRRAVPPVGRPLVLVAGNPNAGKSTVFNAISGARTRVGNYPGVTVSRSSTTARVPGIGPVELVDLPGTYSLAARSREEQVAVDSLLGRMGRAPDAVIVVADATALARTLYFAREVIETGVPVVVALTMMDEARQSAIDIDIEALEARLGVAVIPMVATRGSGRTELLAALGRLLGSTGRATRPHELLPDPLAQDVQELAIAIDGHAPNGTPEARRAWSLWLLLSLDHDGHDDLAGIDASTRAAVRQVQDRAAGQGRNLDLEIIGERYRHIDEIIDRVVRTDDRAERRSLTDRADALLTHRVWGTAVFVAVMLVVFQTLFTWTEPLIGGIETAVAWLQTATTAALPPGPLTSLIVEGVIAGVGNVIVFVPQIAFLFLFIGVMEDVGYLARVAFVIDRVMGGIGLHGKAFVPMLSGFSCAIPAVMATRTIESRTDRLLTMMVLPLMSCSARLPIYVLVTAAIFDPAGRVGFLSIGALVLLAMYTLSVVAALSAAAVLRRTVFRGPRSTLMLELPPYRMPVPSVLVRQVWQRVRTFLVDAGTIILALTIILWAMLSYPRDAATTAAFDARRATVEATLPAPQQEEALAALDAAESGAQIRTSVLGRLGRFIEPAIEPLGFDWRIGIGILGAFAAREVLVSTLGIVFDISDADEASTPLRTSLQQATWPDGRALMTPLAGVSLMVFFVLACQCMSTLAVLRRESGSWRWPAFAFTYMTVLAYVASLLVYQTGRALGLGL